MALENDPLLFTINIIRGAEVLDSLATQINTQGGHVSHLLTIYWLFESWLISATVEQAKSFAIPSYSHEDIISTWSSIHAQFPQPEYTIRSAVFNIGYGVWKPFLEITPQDVQDCLQMSQSSPPITFFILSVTQESVPMARHPRATIPFPTFLPSQRREVPVLLNSGRKERAGRRQRQNDFRRPLPVHSS